MNRPVRRSVPAVDGVESPSGPYRPLKQAGLVALCVMWALLGALGHDPWKTEDATTFGVAWEMLQTGHVLAPTLTGEAYLAFPPLVPALAAAAATLFSHWLAPHDAARLAVSVLLALTLVALTRANLELNGRRTRWLPVLIFIGCIGLWDRAHQLAPEIVLLPGIAGAIYGVALAMRRPVVGGAVVGAAVALMFLGHGLAGPSWVVLALAALPLAAARFRSGNHATMTVVAIVVATIASSSWPVALALSAPEHLRGWWALQVPAGLSSFAREPLPFIRNLPWFTWPALPLAAWMLWTRGRGFNGGLRVPGVEVGGVFAVVIAVALLLAPEAKSFLALPLLVPLAILAAMEVDTLKRGFSAALDWFGILTFGLLAALIWWLWIDARWHGMPAAVAQLFRDTDVGYRPRLQWGALGVSVFLTLLWVALVRPARRSNRRAILNWAAGMTLIWGLYSTIWLPYLDSRRSYRPVAQSLAAHLPADGCVASRQLGEPQRALFRYFANLTTVREESAPMHDCQALLVQFGRIERIPEPPAGWQVAWEGNRRGDDTERFVLYRKVAR